MSKKGQKWSDSERAGHEASIVAEARDWAGARMGRLLVLERVGPYENRQWRIRCDCGTVKVVPTEFFSRGTLSCGCLHRELVGKQARARAQEKRAQFREPPPVDGARWIQVGCHGKFTLVDTDQYENANAYTWRIAGQDRNRVMHLQSNGKTISLPRLILGITDPKIKVDHKSGDTFDNRRSNLRIVNNSQNALNQSLKRNNTSGFKGVVRHRGVWIAIIQIEKKRQHLGTFKSAEEAARAYDTKARELHGAYACVNFPIGDERAAR